MKENKDRIAAIAAARGEQIKTSSAEYLWVCRGIKPPPLPDEPVRTGPEQLQLPSRVLSAHRHLRRQW